MTVLNFSYAYIKDAAKFKQYIEAAGVLMHGCDVEVVVRGEFSGSLNGNEGSPHIAAVFRYPDRETAEGLYSSEKYKALIPLRDEACDMTIHFYDE